MLRDVLGQADDAILRIALNEARRIVSMLMAKTPGQGDSEEPRKRPPAKLHHFVPQFYLRQWCGSDGKLWVYPVDGRAPFRASPRQFAAETNLYTPKPDADAVRHDTESWLSGWESHFAKVWPDVVDRADNPQTRANVARFIGTLIARHPKNRRWILELNELFQRGADGLPDDGEVTLVNRESETKLKASEIREFALTDADSIRTDHVRLMPAASKAAADALMSRRWFVVVAKTPAFITSDDPVVLLRGSCWRPKFGLGSPGTIVNFAVSPFRFLVLADEWERTFAHGLVDDADVFIRRIVSGGNRFVFAAEKNEAISRAIAERIKREQADRA